LTLGGCSYWSAWTHRSEDLDELVVGGSKTKVVGDLAVPFGLFPVKVEAVALVASLPDTGSDPVPSPQRAVLLAQMQTRGVERPSTVLASPNTALVLARGVLRPGIQKGDRFDLEVRIPARSETTSLRGGYLLEARLREMKVLNNQVYNGRVWGIAEGAVLVDPSADDQKDRVLAGRGRVLGGGRATRSRSLGLVLKPGHQNVFNSARVASAVNKRFHKTFAHGIQEGVAKAHTDKYIELTVHPRYKDNVRRYMQVVRSIVVRESVARQIERLALLEQQLLDPITTGRAALQLEAIGRQGVDALKKGIASSDQEVRFRAAEALAYLDQSAAAGPLGEAARNQPAFRVFALAALSVMDDYAAHEQLSALLNVPSAETRYGAFRALWTMNPLDSQVRGEWLDEQFHYHVLGTTGPPMIHVTRSRRPEVVLFGQDQRFSGPLAVEAGPRIMVTTCPEGIAVSRFAAGKPDQKRIVSDGVDEVIRAIVELEGTYPDVVQALQQAKSSGALASRFEVDALPEAGRRYDRIADNVAQPPPAGGGVAQPPPAGEPNHTAEGGCATSAVL
jgi:flagellar basal body P-ring protein FlgI